jgi:hypothetical protein
MREIEATLKISHGSVERILEARLRQPIVRIADLNGKPVTSLTKATKAEDRSTPA